MANRSCEAKPLQGALAVADSMASTQADAGGSTAIDAGPSSCCFAARTARNQQRQVTTDETSDSYDPVGRSATGTGVESQGIRVLTPSEIMRTLPSIGSNNNAANSNNHNNIHHYNPMVGGHTGRAMNESPMSHGFGPGFGHPCCNAAVQQTHHQLHHHHQQQQQQQQLLHRHLPQHHPPIVGGIVVTVRKVGIASSST